MAPTRVLVCMGVYIKSILWPPYPSVEVLTVFPNCAQRLSSPCSHAGRILLSAVQIEGPGLEFGSCLLR